MNIINTKLKALSQLIAIAKRRITLIYTLDQIYLSIAFLIFLLVGFVLFPVEGDRRDTRRYLMQVVAMVGLALSSYACFIGMKNSNIQSVQPICGMEGYSCSMVLLSDQAYMLSFLGIVEKRSSFDISLGQIGIINFIFLISYHLILPRFHNKELVLYIICVLSMICSLGLMKIMYFDIGEICLVCSGIHFSTFIYFILARCDYLDNSQKIKTD